MGTRRRIQFVSLQMLWMLGTILVLAVLDVLSAELFFSLSLLGLLVLAEATTPVNVSPRWRIRLQWLILTGMILFAYLLVRQLLVVAGFLPN